MALCKVAVKKRVLVEDVSGNCVAVFSLPYVASRKDDRNYDLGMDALVFVLIKG